MLRRHLCGQGATSAAGPAVAKTWIPTRTAASIYTASPVLHSTTTNAGGVESMGGRPPRSALLTATRGYVYQPPGSREPNMPWYRQQSSSTASTANSGTATGTTPTGGNVNAATTASAAAPGGVGAAMPSSSGRSSGSKQSSPSAAPTLTRSAAAPMSAAASASPPPPPPPPPSSAVGAALWGSGGSSATAPGYNEFSGARNGTPTPGFPSSSSSSSASPAHTNGLGREVSSWDLTNHEMPPSRAAAASPTPTTTAPPVPLWRGPIELRTPIEYILRQHEEQESGANGSAGGAASDLANGGGSTTTSPADMLLDDLVALLIDPAAKPNVERIPLRTFVSMQPKRQLLALSNKKPWWEWITASAPYREAQRLASAGDDATGTVTRHDLRLLREAGLTTLQHWVEQQHLVAVSPRTKSVLDAAVTTTVNQHISQVLHVVQQSHAHRHLLRQWLSDVVGKFILDSLKLSVEAAAVSVQKARGARWSSRRRLGNPNGSAEEEDLADYDELSEEAVAPMVWGGEASAQKNSRSSSKQKAASSSSSSSSSALRPGEVCTVEHYLLFLQKVTASVRQERWNKNHRSSARNGGSSEFAAGGLGSPLLYDSHQGGGNGGMGAGGTGAGQEEWEVQERTRAVVASAFAHLLQHAVQLHLPAELRELADGGYLALERVPALLQRAATQLQLRTLPVGYFIVHSTASQPGAGGGDEEDGGEGGSETLGMTGDDAEADEVNALLDRFGVDGQRIRLAPRRMVLPGAFLTDDEDPSVPLAQWKRPRRARDSQTSSFEPTPSSSGNGAARNGRASLYDGESLQEAYYSMLYHLQSSLERLSFTSMEELFDDADGLSGCPQTCTAPPPAHASASMGRSGNGSAMPFPGAAAASLHHSGCGSGSSSSSSMLGGVFGEDRLFGAAKLVEDRLATAVSIAPAASTMDKPPVYFIEAGATCGKTALLERLQQRLRVQERIPSRFSPPASSGRRHTGHNNNNNNNNMMMAARGGAVVVRYHSATTPFTPDLDDHPMAFGARFWFRVVLSTMPYFIRSELLFSRAPTSSPLWWSNQQHWSYHTLVRSGAVPINCLPSCILVDDVHRVFDAMEAKWARVLFNARGEPVPSERVRKAFDIAVKMEEETEEAERRHQAAARAAQGNAEELAALRKQEQRAEARRQQQWQELSSLLAYSQNLLDMPQSSSGGGGGDLTSSSSAGGGSGLAAVLGGAGNSGATTTTSGPGARISAALFAASRRQQAVEALQRRTGNTMEEILTYCMSQFTAAQGELHLVLAGQRVSPLLLAYSGGGGGGSVVRQFHLPILRPGSLSWQQRLRVLPPLAVLQALHRRAGLEMPGILYETIKNSPAFIGTAMELLWSATGSGTSSAAAVAAGSTSTSSHFSSAPAAPASGSSSAVAEAHPLHRLLLQHYDAQNLFVEFPLRNRLLCQPRYARHRLIELLQRQLCSPSGYLSTLVDTTLEDSEMGLVIPHNHTLSQVHPFAVFIIFSYQASLLEQQQQQLEIGGSGSHHSERKALAGGQPDSQQQQDVGVVSSLSDNGSMRGAAGSKEQQMVRAWAEVWAEYQETVRFMATTPSRKKEALRVLLHGALLLRAAALSGAGVDLPSVVPPYGFPLLASDVRVRPGRQLPSPATASFAALRRHQRNEGALEVRPASRETVRRAAAAYKTFFAQALEQQSHFAFRPVVGLNAGCDVVLVGGSTLYLYDIAISSHHLGRVIQRRFAEALLGLLHVFGRGILPSEKIRQVQYVTVVCCDQEEEPAYYRQHHHRGRRSAASSADQSPASLLLSSWSPSHSVAGASGSGAAAGSLAGEGSFSALHRSDNMAAAVPYQLDYSALLDDDTMDTLQYLRREVLDMLAGPQHSQTPQQENEGDGDEMTSGLEDVEREGQASAASGRNVPTVYTDESFRTVQDMLDVLEQQFHLSVRQRVLSTFEELEGLLSPTLLQLVPDSMLLPPFTPALVSSEDLLREVMQQQEQEEEEGGLAQSAVEDAASDVLFASAVAANGGAEVDDLQSDQQFWATEPTAIGGRGGGDGPNDPFLAADQEHVFESTALLEAMLNDEDGGAAPAMTSAAAPTPLSSQRGQQQQQQQQAPSNAVPPAHHHHQQQQQRAAEEEGDTLAWLHKAMPVGAAPLGSDAANSVAGMARGTPQQVVAGLPFPYSAVTGKDNASASITGNGTEASIRTAESLLKTAGYNTAALPLDDGDDLDHPGSTAAALEDFDETGDNNADDDDDEFDDNDEFDDDGSDGDEGSGSGSAGAPDQHHGTRGGGSNPHVVGSDEEAAALKQLLQRRANGEQLSPGDRRRLRRLRRRRLAAAATDGKKKKLTVAAALRLRRQQQAQPRRNGVSAITGLSYSDEARFLERFLADERRRQQQPQRRRGASGGSTSSSSSKKKKANNSSSNHNSVGSSKTKAKRKSSGKPSSTAAAKKAKTTVVKKKAAPAKPVRQPKRTKRA